jgi:hypothetical protein
VVTVEEVARGLIAAVASDAGFLLAAQWVADRYQQLAARARLKSTRFITDISVPAATTVGTITVTRGSATVTGNAAATAAFTHALTGRALRVRAAWYDILGVSGGALTLRTPFAEDSGSALPYQIVSRTVPLDPTIRWISDTIVFPRRRWPVTRVPHESLDRLASSRQYSTGGATCWADLGNQTVNDAICKTIELYPYSLDTELYSAVAYPHPRALALTDPVPPEIDAHVLREGAMIDLMRYRMAKALDAGQVDVAATWRNEYRAQETRWERVLLDAFRGAGVGDDVSFLVQRFPWALNDQDIRTGRDEWRATYSF